MGPLKYEGVKKTGTEHSVKRQQRLIKEEQVRIFANNEKMDKRKGYMMKSFMI